MKGGGLGQALALIFSTALAGSAQGQSIGVAYTRGISGTNDLTRSQGATLWLDPQHIPIRLRFTTVGRNQQRFDFPCGGFIVQPCPAEQLAIKTTLSFASFAGRGNIALGNRLDLLVLPGVVAGWVSHSRDGLQTTRSISAANFMIGWEVGAAVAVEPFALPVRFSAGVKALKMTMLVHSEDAFEPYNDGLSLVSADLGIAFRY